MPYYVILPQLPLPVHLFGCWLQLHYIYVPSFCWVPVCICSPPPPHVHSIYFTWLLTFHLLHIYFIWFTTVPFYLYILFTRLRLFVCSVGSVYFCVYSLPRFVLRQLLLVPIYLFQLIFTLPFYILDFVTFWFCSICYSYVICCCWLFVVVADFVVPFSFLLLFICCCVGCSQFTFIPTFTFSLLLFITLHLFYFVCCPTFVVICGCLLFTVYVYILLIWFPFGFTGCLPLYPHVCCLLLFCLVVVVPIYWLLIYGWLFTYYLWLRLFWFYLFTFAVVVEFPLFPFVFYIWLVGYLLVTFDFVTFTRSVPVICCPGFYWLVPIPICLLIQFLLGRSTLLLDTFILRFGYFTPGLLLLRLRSHTFCLPRLPLLVVVLVTFPGCSVRICWFVAPLPHLPSPLPTIPPVGSTVPRAGCRFGSHVLHFTVHAPVPLRYWLLLIPLLLFVSSLCSLLLI